jgi:hypothetical protein
MAKAKSGIGGPAHDAVEIGVAIGMIVFGLIIIIGSLQVGIGWGQDGPRAGFLPFYFGLLIVGSSLINLWNAYREADFKTPFAEWSQLYQVLMVVVPTAVYVTIIPYIGIYISSTLLIAVFMRWIGGYHWKIVGPLSIGVPLFCFVVFERWFLVPLPKGPVEEWLGF